MTFLRAIQVLREIRKEGVFRKAPKSGERAAISPQTGVKYHPKPALSTSLGI